MSSFNFILLFLLYLFIYFFRFCAFLGILGGVPGFLGGVPGFLGGVPGFWGSVPGFLGGCSGTFRCSGVPGSTTCHYPFMYHFSRKKGTPFIYLPLTNGTPFTYLVCDFASLLTAVNALSFQ